MMLGEPGTVAGYWHQSGIVYQRAGQQEMAEDAYRKALAIKVQLGDIAGQASTLVQLGVLYDSYLKRPEEAIVFYRQAVAQSVECCDIMTESRARGNLAEALRILRRFGQAREEILQVIGCDAQLDYATEPWKAWYILAEIEKDTGNTVAAEEAKGKAIASYLAYRRNGGENHYTSGRISFDVTQYLLNGETGPATSILAALAANPSAALLLPLIRALQAIVAGSRDRTLANVPDLTWDMAAEILLLIDMLEKPR